MVINLMTRHRDENAVYLWIPLLVSLPIKFQDRVFNKNLFGNSLPGTAHHLLKLGY
jgi:hypothetical protein